MKNITYQNTKESYDSLVRIKKDYGINFSHAIRMGIALFEQSLDNNESALELGKAYQATLKKRLIEKVK